MEMTSTTSTSRPSVHQLAERGNSEELSRLLKEKPFDCILADSDGVLPLHHAASGNHIACAKLLFEAFTLIKHESTTTSTSTTTTSTTTVPPSQDIPKSLVNFCAGHMKATPLHWACRYRHCQMSAFLVGYGGDPTLADSQGLTPLHVAAQGGDVMLCLYLLCVLSEKMESSQFTTDLINVPDSFGWTPFMWAVTEDHYHSETLARHFHRYGANVNHSDEHGYTAIDFLVRKGCRKRSVQVLYSLGANPQLAETTDYIHTKKLSRDYFSRVPRLVVAYTSMLPVVTLTSVLFAVNAGGSGGGGISPVVAFSLAVFVIACAHILVFRVALAFVDGEHLRRIPYMAALMHYSIVLVGYCWAVNVMPFWWSSPFTTSLFQLVAGVFIVATEYLAIKVCLVDPGYIPKHRSIKAERADILYLAERGILEDKYFCRTCLVRKPVRSKHSVFTDRCVARFDHYCPWIFNDVGDGNHRYFLSFLISLVSGAVYVVVDYAWYLMERVKVESVKCVYSHAGVCELFEADRTTFSIAVWTVFMVAGAMMIMVVQMAYVAGGETTNEKMNAHRYYHKEQPNPYDVGWIGNCVAFWMPGRGVWKNVDWKAQYEFPQLKRDEFV